MMTSFKQIINELNQHDFMVNDNILNILHQAPRVFTLGAGRSGLALRALAMRLTQLNKPTYVVGDTTTPSIRKNDVLLVASSSFKTPQVVMMAKKAHALGAKVILLTGNDDPKIRDQVSELVLFPSKHKYDANNKYSKQPLGSLFEQLFWLYGDSLVLDYMKKFKVKETTLQANHANLE